jgi:hypothetical protein
MAQEQKARKPPQDPYAQRGKTLASSVQRLRGWVGSDPSRAPELADALVELTAHRLLGHGYTAAATDAQEAVRSAAQLLTATGPIGPYTSVTDAARYLTAVVQLATIQAGIGLPDTAGRTIESLQDMQQQLQELRLEAQLKPQTAIWALSCTARAALAAGDVAAANAYADAALARLAESGLGEPGVSESGAGNDDAAYLAIDVDRLVSDCRWAAGRVDEALTYLHVAKDRYDEVVGGRLYEPARLSPTLMERLAEPLFGLYRDLADRLAATGEVDLGLVSRRTLVARLQALASRLGDPARVQLASALADLAGDLLAVERVEEAASAAAEATALVLGWSGAGSTSRLVAAVRARVLTRRGQSGEAVATLRQALPGDSGESPSAAHLVSLAALAEAQRAEGDLDSATSTELALGDLTRALVGPSREGAAARSAVEDLARGVVSQGAEPLSWMPLDPSASYATTTAGTARTSEVGAVDLETKQQRETAAWLEAERSEAHRQEQERLAQVRLAAEVREAERVRAERAAAEQLAIERAQAEQAQRLEAERRAAAEEAERLERKRRREERLETHRLEAERLEAQQREAERLYAERRAAEVLAADPAEAERRELARLQADLAELERAEERALAERLEAEQRAADHAAQQQADQAEAERREAEQAEAETERREAEQAEEAEAELRDAEQAEAAQAAAQRRDAEQEAEEAEAQQAEAEQAEAEQAEAEQAEAERREAEQAEAEQAEAEYAEAEYAETRRREAEPRELDEPDELALAQQVWRDAQARRDRREARVANERVVELLRSRAHADLASYGPQLQDALEELSSARLRSGDVWGSRASAKEAKALAKTLGR